MVYSGLAPKIPFRLDYQEQSLVPQDSIYALCMPYHDRGISHSGNPSQHLHRLFINTQSGLSFNSVSANLGVEAGIESPPTVYSSKPTGTHGLARKQCRTR